MAALSVRGIDFRQQTQPFAFSDVASRCRGRIDIRHGLDRQPFSDAALVQHPGWWPVVQHVLGSDACLNYAGLVVSLAGSDDQQWHVDGPHLFSDVEVPAHALTVFIPLVDVDETLGCPQFFLGSHLQAVARKMAEGDIAEDPVDCSPMSAGSVVVFDYRLVHRGTANTHSTVKEHKERKKQ